jgi:hypothetical protein
MQERLITIIVEDVAALRSDVAEKDLTYTLTIDGLYEVLEKWSIPIGAHNAFTVAAFEVMVFIGEKRLVMEGASALLNLTPSECHALFSPVLAAFEDAGTMEGWLAITEELAAPLSKIQMFKHIVPFRKSLSKAEEDKNFDCDKDYGLEQNCVSTKKLSDYDNHENAVFLAKLRSIYDRSMAEVQTRNLAIYLSNRNITLALFCSMLIYETLVTVGIVINADLPVSEGVLFTLYTITSAGFGNIVIPKTDGFLIFAVVNVFISISMLAILVRSHVRQTWFLFGNSNDHLGCASYFLFAV